MTSWMAERDRLLAQANSLVKPASTARPSPNSFASEKPHDRPLTPQLRPASSAPTPYSPPPASHVAHSRQRSVSEGEADHQPLTFRRNLRSEAQPTETIPIPMLATSERDDIEIRVSRFRAQQTKLAMERQAHYERTQSNIKSKLLKKSDW